MKNLKKLNPDQEAALENLSGPQNVFLTGAAGSGKSFLMRSFLREREKQGAKRIPILASTGAAAILVGGRTFHSFFGLGILEGGIQKTVDRALKDSRLVRRLETAEAVVIDEISMLSGPTLEAAEKISRCARDATRPWGGLRIIAVGDFAQLPPVNRFTSEKEWAFLSPVWGASEFDPVVLRKSMRSQNEDFLDVLNDVRLGQLSERVREFLLAREAASKEALFETDSVTRLFGLRDRVEEFNLARLAGIDSELVEFETKYQGKARDIETFQKHSPLPPVISLKEGALVMIRQNDNEGRFVNGTTGKVVEIDEEGEKLRVELHSGRMKDEVVTLEKAEFTLLNAEGTPVVTAKNFPVTLAWAMTIHKAQGASLDGVQMDLSRIWEPGQAYVALSRARDPERLYVDAWRPSAIFADPAVERFHRGIGG